MMENYEVSSHSVFGKIGELRGADGGAEGINGFM
jgi:hypothetical protein